METVSFDRIYHYNTLKTGITVSVAINVGNTIVDFQAKVDTGSSFCVFERTHAERLNLNIEDGEFLRISTATGTFEAFGHELEIEVLGIKVFSTVYFAKEEWFTRNVLGRQGWLDRVKLGLIDYEGKLLLGEYGE